MSGFYGIRQSQVIGGWGREGEVGLKNEWKKGNVRGRGMVIEKGKTNGENSMLSEKNRVKGGVLRLRGGRNVAVEREGYKGLNIWCVNIGGLLKKVDEMRKMVESERIDMLVLGETHITKNTSDGEIKIEGYNMVRLNSRSSHTGGIIIYCNSSIGIEVSKVWEENRVWMMEVVVTAMQPQMPLAQLGPPQT